MRGVARLGFGQGPGDRGEQLVSEPANLRLCSPPYRRNPVAEEFFESFRCVGRLALCLALPANPFDLCLLLGDRVAECFARLCLDANDDSPLSGLSHHYEIVMATPPGTVLRSAIVIEGGFELDVNSLDHEAAQGRDVIEGAEKLHRTRPRRRNRGSAAVRLIVFEGYASAPLSMAAQLIFSIPPKAHAPSLSTDSCVRLGHFASTWTSRWLAGRRWKPRGFRLPR